VKQSAKSCSCRQCRRAKHACGGKQIVKAEERAHRHACKQQLRQLGEDALISPAVHGSRIG
jgi:hypothetical protein